ncbi:MAG: tRNA pseudouridine(38-40) synthase TruA [Bacillota bacterium]|nr:tRNA pseudouridine(38-40) synthase TruA [Bacillota bacterium]MDW7676933.1 tRNA pseudouridine(38-40) synthase TruA [Bacillota bacterium]
MRTIRIFLEYQGTHYCGWQIQPNGMSIQQKLMEAVHALTGEKVTIHGAGRTDAGVHARGQCASFATESSIPPERWAYALNAHLPEDIAVVEASEEDKTFHARYSAIGKQYSYQLYIHPHRSPLMSQYAWHIRQQPDVEMMKQALVSFQGTHDFSAFRSANSDVKNTVRTIWSTDLCSDGRSVWLVFRGNGFLYKMVRMMVAAVIQVGFGKQSTKDIYTRIHHKGDSGQRLVAPPQGLFLDRVYYQEIELPVDSMIESHCASTRMTAEKSMSNGAVKAKNQRNQL